jgi:hypothetical protein
MRFLSSTHRSVALRIWLPLATGLLLTACGRSAGPDALEPSESVVERYPDSTRKVVEVRAGADSVVERRFYRPTGALRRVERGDSVAGYMDLHDLDSARVLRDYLQGRWRNTSASLSDPEANAYYVFDGESLTFRTPNGESLETIGVDYGSNRVLHTEDGMPVTANIAGFDTVTVTGYTLVRQDTSAGMPEENRP